MSYALPAAEQLRAERDAADAEDSPPVVSGDEQEEEEVVRRRGSSMLGGSPCEGGEQQQQWGFLPEALAVEVRAASKMLIDRVPQVYTLI